MAGGIWCRSSDQFWSTSSSLFYWVIDQLAGAVADPQLAAELREISEYHLGALDLDERRQPAQLRELYELLARMPKIAAARYPDEDGDGIAGVLSQLRELADYVPAPDQS